MLGPLSRLRPALHSLSPLTLEATGTYASVVARCRGPLGASLREGAE